MADYYNRTRTPLGVTLRGGGSISVGPKTWCYIAPADEGTPGLASMLRKGFLVKAAVPITETTATTPAIVAAVPSVTPIPEVAISSVAEPATKPSNEPLPAPELKSSRRNK